MYVYHVEYRTERQNPVYTIFSGGTAAHQFHSSIRATHQSKVGVDKDHVGLVGSLDTLGVHDTAAGGGNVFRTGSSGSVDIVWEGEEGV
jgi:hypothetical protein